MYIGFLTAPFRQEPFDSVVEFAKANGFGGMEVVTGVGVGHIDAKQVLKDNGSAVKKLLEGTELRISSLAAYGNTLDPDLTRRKQLLRNLHTIIDAAAVLEVPVVCTLAGMPVPGKSKMQTIEEEALRAFTRLCEHAAEKEVKIALENWFATNLQGLHHWRRFFEVVPSENIGLNFDPSHLVHQDIDYLHAVDHFRTRIFHIHAKDTEIRWDKRRWMGNLEHGWWRYVIPGFGVIDWGQFIGVLRSVGYDGVLSIEHEDGAMGREEGFIKGRKFLAQFV